MSLLHVLRNLAALVILTVGALGLNPQAGAAPSVCQPNGGFCTSSIQCCSRICGHYHNCCIFPGKACFKNSDCCGLSCAGHRCV